MRENKEIVIYGAINFFRFCYVCLSHFMVADLRLQCSLHKYIQIFNDGEEYPKNSIQLCAWI